MKKIALVILFITFLNGLIAQDISSISLTDANSGNQFELAKLKSAKAAVLIFFGNRCAYNNYYVDRIKKLVRDYEPKGVQFVFINSNRSDIIIEESPEKMKEFISSNQLSLPYLVDDEQVLKKALKASRSPEVFLITFKGDKQEVLYTGAIDDNPQSQGDVGHAYLNDAIVSLLEKNNPLVTKTRPIGCLLK